MWFPPFVLFFSIEFFVFVCFPFLWLQYSTVIFAASLQRSLQFQKNKKKFLFLRFAQQKAPCFVHTAQRWALGAKKENARKCCERFVVFCHWYLFISDDRVEPSCESDYCDARSYKWKHISFSFRFRFSADYLNRYIQNISGDFLRSSARIKTQNAVIVISPFVVYIYLTCCFIIRTVPRGYLRLPL